jgi:hypothetical protein
MTNHVEQIVAKLGGPTKCSRVVGVHVTRIHAWVRAGVVPSRSLPALVAAARDHGVDVDVSRLVGIPPGADRGADLPGAA